MRGFEEFEPNPLSRPSELVSTAPKVPVSASNQDLNLINTLNSPVQKPKPVSKPNQNTLYGWMVSNGFDAADASYKGRKQIWQKIFGDVPYSGTVDQNNKLLSVLKNAGNRATDVDFVASMNNLRPLK